MRKFYTLIILLLFFSKPVTAQQPPDNYSWKQIEKGIASKMTLNHFTKILENRRQIAPDEKNESDLARCFFLLSQIRDRKTEDTLFWKNSFYIDSIAKDPSSSVYLKSLMHILKSERIQEYKRKFSHRNNKNLIANYNSGQLFQRQLKKLLDTVAGKKK